MASVKEFLNDAILHEKTYEEVTQWLLQQAVPRTEDYDYYIHALAKRVIKSIVQDYEAPTAPVDYIKLLIEVLSEEGFKLPIATVHTLLILILQNWSTYGLSNSENATFIMLRPAIRDQILNLLIEFLASPETVAEVRSIMKITYYMDDSLFENLTKAIFRILIKKPELSPRRRIVVEKLLPPYEARVIDALRAGIAVNVGLDEEATEKLLGRVYAKLGQSLFAIFQQIREEEGINDFQAALAYFQKTVGPFKKSTITHIIHAASPLYHTYMSGARIAAGKTLVNPNGNINISNFPRNRPNSAFALHAMRHFLPRYGARQAAARLSAQAGALIAEMDPNVATKELLARDPARQAEMINFLYSHAPNNSNSLAASAVTALRQPALKPATERYYLQTATTAHSLANFAHASGYEPPENLGSYERTEGPARKPALGRKPAAGRTVRFNNAAKTVKNVEKYKGGRRQKMSLARFLTQRKKTRHYK